MEIPPVTLAGYFGFGNAGDEMILALLQQRLGPTLFLSGPRPIGTGAVSRFHLPSVWRALARSRALVLGGGELFQTRTSLRSLFYYTALPWMARWRGRSVAGFGFAIDPALGKTARSWVAATLRSAKGLWVRDETSRRFLAAHGVTARLMPDIVWAWPKPSVAPAKELRRILWVLRFPRTGQGGTFRLDANWPATWEHAVLALDPVEDAQGMGRFRRSAPFFTRRESWSGPGDLLTVFGRYDLIVTMRYHGLVCAALAGRPAVAVPGHGKVRDLAVELGVPVVHPWAGPLDWPQVFNAAFSKGPPDLGHRPDDARRALSQLAELMDKIRPDVSTK